jgi:hypothetical protein
MYGSSVDDKGTNVALFDLDAARFIYGKLFQTTKVLYEFDSNYLRRRRKRRRAKRMAKT